MPIYRNNTSAAAADPFTEADVLATGLTNIDVATTGDVSEADTVLTAIGKLQATKSSGSGGTCRVLASGENTLNPFTNQGTFAAAPLFFASDYTFDPSKETLLISVRLTGDPSITTPGILSWQWNSSVGVMNCFSTNPNETSIVSWAVVAKQ